MAEPTTETTEKTAQCADGACVLPQQAPTPWCQVLMPNLVLAQAATGKTVYYVDTLNTLSDPVLKAFRDAYEISFVPTLLAFRAGQVGAKYDGDRSIADVQLFLQNN
ncbi:hypothetical protein [Schleiferilactobacillus harbinensis]|uniref:hypothetical protein n=1 Tax=Schleiferilactobacillus harbinensis TaxID=304207 RepID=UPI0007B7A3D2|nr:hypothetical protein [Schleiferilactobacillus harbinensis]